MVEGDLSSGHRVRLVQMFGTDMTAWRSAIATACQERSWGYHEHWEGEAPDSSSADIVIVSPVETSDPSATTWVVMSSSPGQVVEAMHGFGFCGHEAIFHASKVLALGAALAQRGAVVIDGLASSIDMPHLGMVSLDRSGAPAAVSKSAYGLELYQVLPPKSGVTYNIDLGSLDFPIFRETDSGGPTINLLGKRRTLFVTPLLFIPPGRWRVVVVFSIQMMTPVHLRFVWGFGTDVADVEEVISRSGRYEMSVERQWNEVGPASITGLLGASRLEGELVLESVGVVLEPASGLVDASLRNGL